MPTSSISPSSPIARAGAPSEMFRRERLLWVTSGRHTMHTEEPLAARARAAELHLAAARDRAAGGDRAALPRALLELEFRRGRGRRARRSCGLGVAGIGLAAGHARARAADGFPELPRAASGWCAIRTRASALADALAEHIVSSLDNLSDAQAAAE